MSETKTSEQELKLEEAALDAIGQAKLPSGLPVEKELAPAPVESEADEGVDIPTDPEEKVKFLAVELKKLLGDSAPTEQMLRSWKQTYGEIFILPLDSKVFIYRYLKRQEWVQIQSNESLRNMREDQYEDMLFNKCMLWPRFTPEQMAVLPAGATELICSQIRLQSLFLDPVHAANVTIKL